MSRIEQIWWCSMHTLLRSSLLFYQIELLSSLTSLSLSLLSFRSLSLYLSIYSSHFSTQFTLKLPLYTFLLPFSICPSIRTSRFPLLHKQCIQLYTLMGFEFEGWCYSGLEYYTSTSTHGRTDGPQPPLLLLFSTPLLIMSIIIVVGFDIILNELECKDRE